MAEEKYYSPAEWVEEILGGPRQLSRDLAEIGTKVHHSNISRWKNNGGMIGASYHKPLLVLAAKKRRRNKLTEKHLIHGNVVSF
jgi:hypothetical protein